MMRTYYQQAAPGYESCDPPLSGKQKPESETESGLPARDTIAVDENGRGNKRENAKSSKSHRSPPITDGNKAAHPAAVRAAIAEVNQERKQARTRAKQCVKFTYFTSKVMGIMANLLLMAFNMWIIFFRQEDRILISRSRPAMVQDHIQRVYLLLCSLAAVLAELDTPFARENFRAWQKWWFKAPFYVFTAFLNGMGDFTLQLWPTLQLICFVLLSCAAVSSLVLQFLIKQILGKMVAGKKRRTKQKSKLKGKTAGRTPNRHPVGNKGAYGSVKGATPKKRGKVVLQPRKNPIKWWQEDGVDSYDAADMETSSMISSEGRSTANGSKWWEADVESDVHSELDVAPVGGYHSALSSSSYVPLVSRERKGLEDATESARAGDHVPSGLTLEQRPPPISSSPTATDDEAV